MRLFSRTIPIRVHPFFFVLSALIGWMNSASFLGTLVWMGVILVSVLIHELGHALTALLFGQRVVVELHGMGGTTRRFGPPLKLWKEFFIVLNGPLAGLILFFAAYLIYSSFAMHSMNIALYALEITVYANLFWTVVNLLPVYPLDGGQLLRIILEAIFGLRGIRIALFMSMIFAAAAGVFFLQYGAFVAGMFFFLFAFEGYRSWQEAQMLKEQDRNVDLQHEMKNAENEMRRGNEEEALNLFMDIRQKANEGVLFKTASEYAARILSSKMRAKEAFDLLAPLKKTLDVEALRLFQRLAYETAHWKEAIDAGNRIFQNLPDYETAFLNALSHSILGEIKPAIGWLQTAKNEGFPNFSKELERSEFDPIRLDPDFQKL